MSGQISGFIGENPQIRVEAMRTLNPATYVPGEEGEPLHSCKEVLDKVFSSRPDLVDTAIPNTDLELFTDGSWSPQKRKKAHKTGANPERKDTRIPDTRKGSRRPGKADTYHHSFGQNLPERTVTKTSGHSQSATLTQLASKACLHCAQHNPGQGRKPPLLIPKKKKGVYPFQHVEIDFTEIQPSKIYQYLLVVVCTFTDWMGAYPTHTEKATEVSRALAKKNHSPVRGT
jgi:hypothetical protein